MHIRLVEIGNFRKLQSVRIDFSEKTTVFVGANNSGKSSAMVVLQRFLVHRTGFSVNDFTLTHWKTIDKAAAIWEKQAPDEETKPFDWHEVLPYVDVWLDVPKEELHFVQKLLPTLDWNGSNIGVRLIYEPKDAQALRRDYLIAKRAATSVMDASGSGEPVPVDSEASKDAFNLWPRSMMDFLARHLLTTFQVKAYLLDPVKLLHAENGLAKPQKLPDESEAIDGDPFKGLIRIDEISAQRGFGFVARTGSTNDDSSNDRTHRLGSRLSGQLRSYYDKHLNPFDTPEPKDLGALQALHAAQAAFGKRLTTSFAAALKELEEIGYPGVTDPRLTITTKIKPVDGLSHSSAVQYEVPTHQAECGGGHHLPEESNGLGYQNLVSMVFDLMSYRDRWMKVGKAGKVTSEEDALIPPLHLVLIEEPEAYLHAQVQQVFINQAYKVLRNHEKLKASKELRTQLVVSTHSSHIAHEVNFASLRYFRRLPAAAVAGAVPVSSVVNLSEVFGDKDKTERFVRRLIEATHCDLFFADAAILVEGSAERILVPHFVRYHDEFEYLRSRYITWLEIGGSHAHRLKSLLQHLGLNTLIITDIDVQESDGSAAIPNREKNLSTRNATLKTWIPAAESFDDLLDKKSTELVSAVDGSGYAIRVAYQQPIMVTFKSATPAEALANTFEDAILYENIELFKDLGGYGLIAKFRKALTDATDLYKLAERVSAGLKDGSKADFALDLLYSEKSENLKVPVYIRNGLLWLSERLKRNETDLSIERSEVGG